MAPTPGTPDNPLRVAIVGSGPAGFYAAGQLLSDKERSIEVDVFDRLATPWGLVRYGVAPDHPKIKSVTRVFEKTAAKEGFRFHGNVEVGVDVSHEELAGAYHAVLYAFGAAKDRKLGIPGEELAGSHAATEFVAWYNGHPDYADHDFDLSAKTVVVVGNGNVALDVARMLALDVSELEVTDTADHAIEVLARSSVEEIVVLGRRGPAQAAFTNPELRELADLHDADVIVDAPDGTWVGLEGIEPINERNVEILRDYQAGEPQGRKKRIVLRFGVSPVEILGSDRVEGVRVVHNELVEDEGRVSARPTGESEVIEAQLVVRSVGYTGSPLPGVPFDDAKGTIHNRCGRVTRVGSEDPLPGVYTAGWVKRGPSGVIGTNKKCAQETVDLLIEDLDAGRLPEPTTTPSALLEQLEERGVEVVDYAGWELIDAHEKSLGEPHGRPRVKLVRRAEHLLHAAASKVRT
jgi:ferredoxin--NADP+ reductase